MRFLLPAPILVPLLGAAMNMLVRGRIRLHRVVSITALAAVLGCAVALVAVVADGSVHAVALGGRRPPLGIPLVVDPLAALILLALAVTGAAVLLFAIGSRTTPDDAPYFHTLYLVMVAGGSAVLLTGDLFNLFVSLEVTLTSTYALLLLGGSHEQLRAGSTYIVTSVVATTLLLIAVAVVYGATGTVTIADLVARLGALPDGLRRSVGLLLLAALGVKAAVFPVFSWLPDSYPAAPAPIAAAFAGILTKLGVYAIIRTETLLFAPEEGIRPELVVVALATMTVGAVAALGEDDLFRLLSFQLVSQVGFVLAGLALFSVAGIAAAVFLLVHEMVVKTGLFLVAALLEERSGSSRLRAMGGVLHRAPLTAALFLPAAASLAAVPPLSGFVGKLALLRAAVAADAPVVVAVVLAVSLLTVASMASVWRLAFWGGPPPLGTGQAPPGLAVAAAGVVVLASLAVAAAAAPLVAMADDAAGILLGRDRYVREVLAP